MNKKVKALARASAFSHKATNGSISVIEDFSFEAPKTKDFKAVLANLSLTGKKSLFITSEHNPNVYISSRNIQRTQVCKCRRGKHISNFECKLSCYSRRSSSKA